MYQGTPPREITGADSHRLTEFASPRSVPRECLWCFGSGRIPNDVHQRYDRCELCGGTGVRPTSPAIRLQGQPAVEIVAEAA